MRALSEPAEPPPFDLYRPTVTAALPTLLDHAPTSLRHPLLRAGLRISAASEAGFRAALDARGFTEIHTPKIVASATESGGASYLQVFSHGMPPHGGFAIGLERWTARLTGATNVRQVTTFPRDCRRLAP